MNSVDDFNPYAIAKVGVTVEDMAQALALFEHELSKSLVPLIDLLKQLEPYNRHRKRVEHVKHNAYNRALQLKIITLSYKQLGE